MLARFVLLVTMTVPLHAAEPVKENPPPGSTAESLVLDLLRPAAPDRRPDPASIERLESSRKLGADRTAEHAAIAWLDRNRVSLTDVVVPEVPDFANAGLRFTIRNGPSGQPTTLFAHGFRHHASGKLVVYGVGGKNLRRAYWLGESQKDLKVEDTGRDLWIEVTPKNGKPLDPIATVIALEFDGAPVFNPLTIVPRTDGSILLHSKQAQVIGVNLRYEPEPNKNTVGYWTNPKDYVVWDFRLDKAGDYDVELLQGCGKGSGGSEVEIAIAASDAAAPQIDSFSMVVEDTGHFQNFIPRVVGRVRLGPGSYRLTVIPKTKKGIAVMDLRQVLLKPQ